MKRELINELYSKFELAKGVVGELECWDARLLQTHLGYSDWRNFLNVIERAKKSCENSGGVVTDHFVDITRMVEPSI